MIGHLNLVCGLGANGRSQLREQSFRAPIHISKPHFDEETLVVNMVNPTAGLFEGDEITCKVHVETGARLLLTSPSASRAHAMAAGGEARLTQQFSVDARGWLEISPEILIPQAGTRYRQKTRVDLNTDSGLFFVETLAPGRVASGEVFQFQYLDWETEIYFKGERVVREKYLMSPASLQSLRKQFDTGYYACIFLFHPKITTESPCWQAIETLHDKSAWVGRSRLHRAGWSIKILAAESIQFRKTLNAVRLACYDSMECKAPGFRRF